MPLLDVSAVNPIVLPNGQVAYGTVYLKNFLDHPRITIGDYSYASRFDTPENWAARDSCTSRLSCVPTSSRRAATARKYATAASFQLSRAAARAPQARLASS